VRYRVEPLDTARHDCVHFSSGNDTLDEYLRERASQDVRRSVASVFCLVGVDTSEVIGFYTLSAASVRLIDLPGSLGRRLPRYPDVPAYLLGRLAVDLTYQGQGLGEFLLVDAFRRASGSEIAAVGVLVDAMDESAASFYRGYGFEPLPGRAHRLLLSMKKVQKLSGLP